MTVALLLGLWAFMSWIAVCLILDTDDEEEWDRREWELREGKWDVREKYEPSVEEMYAEGQGDA